jgi:hypothetical protein
MKNVLYVGMEADIILPFLVEPDFDNLFVINENDIAYGTWKEQIEDILSILENGSDEFIEKPVEHPITGILFYTIKGPIAKLPEGHCKILSSNTEEAKEFELYKYRESTQFVKRSNRHVTFSYFLTKDKTKCWKVKFLYGGKVRTLTYYLRDFYDKWPKEVNNIDALLWCGAFTWKMFTDGKTIRKYNIQKFRENIEKRCNLPLNIYAETDYFPYISIVNTSKYEDERMIGKYTLKNFDEGWWKKDFSLKK